MYEYIGQYYKKFGKLPIKKELAEYILLADGNEYNNKKTI